MQQCTQVISYLPRSIVYEHYLKPFESFTNDQLIKVNKFINTNPIPSHVIKFIKYNFDELDLIIGLLPFSTFIEVWIKFW